MKFTTAQLAFEYFYGKINFVGEETSTTKRLQHVGFYILNPMENLITTPWRNWKEDYAKKEWEWYLSKDRKVTELKKFAKIWDTMHNGDDVVNSNYGYQWDRSGQLEFVIRELSINKESRRAVISIYDGKEHSEHSKDTPCTLSIAFTISNGLLNMSVLMRSNDLWFGFCNDQYCFSKLLELVANRLGLPIGWYHHFVIDLHLYHKHLNKKPK